VVADDLDHLMPQHHHPLERRPAEVEVAVLEPQVLVRQFGVRQLRHVERRRRTAVEDDQFGRLQFDLAGGQVGVLLAGQPLRDRALDGDAELAPQLLGGLDQLGLVGLEHDLRQPVPVAEVDEHQRPLVAAGVHPAVEDDGLAGVAGAQLAAGVRSPQDRHVGVLGPGSVGLAEL
jgi:hypothetical protein